MCRYEIQKRRTRSRKRKNVHDDEKSKIPKIRYISDQDFDAYQNVLRVISHR